ncbi:unnamed protein product [Cochlearia groenlandica]
MILDLPRDLAEEVLCKFPLTCLREVRLTCKKLDTLSKSCCSKKKKKEIHVVMILDGKIYLMNFNLNHLLWASIEPIRWIKPRSSYRILDEYAHEYANKSSLLRSHKILRVVSEIEYESNVKIIEIDIYNLNSNLATLTGTLHSILNQAVQCLAPLVSWYVLTLQPSDSDPHLPLPFASFSAESVAMSSVGENQLAVLFQNSRSPYTMQIWMSDKIENPSVVSWRSNLFLEFDMEPLVGFQYFYMVRSFLVDEEKKLVVVIDKYQERSRLPRNIAYIIGKNGGWKTVDLGESIEEYCSYVPSSVQI